MTKPKPTHAAPRAHALPGSRSEMLRLIKRHGPLAAGELARYLRITREAARQQLQSLEQEGRITRTVAKPAKRSGRPAIRFTLTPAGDQLFPKHYDALSLTLVDGIVQQLGPEALEKLLTALTDQRVRQWEPKLVGKSLAEKLRAIQGIYFEGDPYIAVEKDRRGYLLVEHNCPYLNLALARPQLCSVTVSTLTRLLGVRVVREKRFQDGCGCCAFRIFADQPVNSRRFRFALEAA